MSKQCIVDLSILFATAAIAQDAICVAKATEIKLAGAAKNSFEKKCIADAKLISATMACEATSKETKLAGVAEASFERKRITYATGAWFNPPEYELDPTHTLRSFSSHMVCSSAVAPRRPQT